ASRHRIASTASSSSRLKPRMESAIESGRRKGPGAAPSAAPGHLAARSGLGGRFAQGQVRLDLGEVLLADALDVQHLGHGLEAAGLLAVLDDARRELGAHSRQSLELLGGSAVDVDLARRRGLGRGVGETGRQHEAQDEGQTGCDETTKRHECSTPLTFLVLLVVVDGPTPSAGGFVSARLPAAIGLADRTAADSPLPLEAPALGPTLPRAGAGPPHDASGWGQGRCLPRALTRKSW